MVGYANFWRIFDAGEQRDLRDYWTEVHQIFIRCSQVTAAVNAYIGFAIFQSISILHSDE